MTTIVNKEKKIEVNKKLKIIYVILEKDQDERKVQDNHSLY